MTYAGLSNNIFPSFETIDRIYPIKTMGRQGHHVSFVFMERQNL